MESSFVTASNLEINDSWIIFVNLAKKISKRPAKFFGKKIISTRNNIDKLSEQPTTRP